MKDTNELENKAVKPQESKSAKDIERERFEANRRRKAAQPTKDSAFGNVGSDEK